MFHFTKKDREREVGLVQRIIAKVKSGCLIIICIQDTGNKVDILNNTLNSVKKLHRLTDQPFKYVFEDKESGHRSETNYRMIIVEK